MTMGEEQTIPRLQTEQTQNAHVFISVMFGAQLLLDVFVKQ